MADSQIDIILKGHDQASSAIAGVNREISGLDRTATIAKGTLAGILTADVIAKVGDFAKSAAGLVLELGKNGEESVQEDAHFKAIAGGSAEAAKRLSAMRDAVGDYMTEDQMMAASTRIMSLGLADTAEGAADLARQAITLGDSTQTAEQRIQTFTQMLATGQTRGLAAFGLSVIAVRARVDELKKANADMSTAMASQQAIQEAAAERMALLGDYMPITQTDQMRVKIGDLKDKLGDLVATPYIISVEFVTTGVENIISLLNRTSNDAGQQLTGLEQQLKNAKEELASMQQTTGKGVLGGLFNQKYSEEQLAAVQKNIDDLTAKIEYMRTINASSGDVGAAALDKQSNAAILLKDNLQAVEDKMLEMEQTGTEKLAEDTGATVSVKALLGLDAEGADTAALEESLGRPMKQVARAAHKAFADAMTGISPKTSAIVDALFGLSANEKGEKPADTAAERAVNTLASSIQAQIAGEDFAGRMIGYGETVWGYVEEGMISKAKSSGAFQAAIDAMVAGAIAGALQ